MWVTQCTAPPGSPEPRMECALEEGNPLCLKPRKGHGWTNVGGCLLREAHLDLTLSGSPRTRSQDRTHLPLLSR